MAFALTLAVLGLISTPPFRVADAPNGIGHPRSHVIDGVRGFAALGVFFHHALITHDYIARDVWQLPPSRFYSMAGQVGVSVFFLITGYLFWAKLLRERGRPAWFSLYMGRVFRIGPVYALALLGLLIAVAMQSVGRPMESGAQILAELGRWISLGMFSAVPINAVPHTRHVLAGVVWTLQYEWAFYAALLALSIGALRERWALPFTVALAGVCSAWWYEGGPFWLGPFDAVFALLFVGGMGCASLDARHLTLRAPRWVLSAACLSIVVAVFVLFPSAYGMLPTVLLCAAFYLVTSGADIFGLLRSRAAQRLGAISFGIYMLQGLTLTLVFAPARVRTRAVASDVFYWTVVVVAAVALLAFAALAHRWVERPGIEGGRKIIGRIVQRRPRLASTVVEPDPVRR